MGHSDPCGVTATFLVLNTCSAAGNEQPNFADVKASHGPGEAQGELGEPGDMTVTVEALKETPPGETRAAVTPASLKRLRASGIDVLVECDAGAGALLPARTCTDIDASSMRSRRSDAQTPCSQFTHQMPHDAHSCVGASSSADCCKLAQTIESSPHSTMPGSSRWVCMPILDVDHAKSVVVIKCSMGHGYAGIDIELHTNPKTRVYFAGAQQALSTNHVRDQDPRRLRSTTSKTVAKNRRELKEVTRWHTRPSTRTTTR